MEIKVNRVDTANAKIECVLSMDDIAKKVEKVARDAAKTMKIDGFRKGKVPLSVVKRRFGEKLSQDAENESLRELVDRAIKDLNIKIDELIGEPQITKYNKSSDKIDVEIDLGIKPQIELGDYLSLIPEVPEMEVSEDEINERIKGLAKAQAPFTKIEENRAVKNGDFALIDFEGFLDGVAFDGGKAEGHNLEIGSGSFITGFEEQIVGMNAGESKDIKVTFPDNYGSKNLAGKEVTFKVKLNEIQEKVQPEINDELAKKMLPSEANATVEMLKEKVKEQIASEKRATLYNDELKPSLIDSFVEAFNFDLPTFVIEQETDLILRNKLQTLSEDEIKEYKDNKDKVTELRDTLKDEAYKSVKVTFLIDALSKKEEVDIAENELMQTIYYEAMQMGQEPQKLFELYQKQGLLPAIKMAMVEDRLLSQLLDKKLKEAN
jgi:trigger factor